MKRDVPLPAKRLETELLLLGAESTYGRLGVLVDDVGAPMDFGLAPTKAIDGRAKFGEGWTAVAGLTLSEPALAKGVSFADGGGGRVIDEGGTALLSIFEHQLIIVLVGGAADVGGSATREEIVLGNDRVLIASWPLSNLRRIDVVEERSMMKWRDTKLRITGDTIRRSAGREIAAVFECDRVSFADAKKLHPGLSDIGALAAALGAAAAKASGRATQRADGIKEFFMGQEMRGQRRREITFS